MFWGLLKFMNNSEFKGSRFFEFFWGRNLLFPLYSSRYLEIFWDLLRFFEFCLILSVLLCNNPCACPSIHLHWHALALFPFSNPLPLCWSIYLTQRHMTDIHQHIKWFLCLSCRIQDMQIHKKWRIIPHMSMWNHIDPCFFERVSRYHELINHNP